MSNDLTPEERLLRLIRGKTKSYDSNPNIQKTSSKTPGHPKAKLDEATNRRSEKLPAFFSFKIISIFLCIIIISFVGYSIFESLSSQLIFNVENREFPIEEAEIIKEPALAYQAKPYSYYSQKINRRDLFDSFSLSDGAIDISLNPSLGSKFNNLSLVGIVLDEEPQAIIENKTDKKSYFLRKGDFIGDIKIEEILDGKVIVSYAGEEFEMVP